MKKSLSKKLITYEKSLSPYEKHSLSSRPQRQLSQKEFMQSKNTKSISTCTVLNILVVRRTKDSPDKGINTSMKIISPLKKVDPSIQAINSVLAE